MNIKEFLIKQAEKFPEKPAFIFNNISVSFSELSKKSFSLGNFLLQTGFTQNDKIAVFLPSIPEAIFSYLGIFSIGAALIPFDFMLTEEELIHLLNHSEAKGLIIQSKQHFDINNIKKSCPFLKHIILCKEKSPFNTNLEDILRNYPFKPPETVFDEKALSSIFYTSGSTGHPKGVMLTYSHFDNPVWTLCYLPLSSDDVTLCAGLPFSHLGGFDYILLMLYLGQTLILMDRFHPLETLRNIEQYRVTFLWMVPPMYVAILSLKEAGKFNLNSLKWLNVFGAPSSPELLQRFHALCPNTHIFNGWGMTETAAPNCFVTPGINNIESIGKFMSGLEGKIVDEGGSCLGPGKQGELLVRGKMVMLGYYKEPQMTEEVITEDGWFKTGDIAKVDSEGFYYIVGRKKDMIKVAGELVFSVEVEEKIQRHPKVKEVGVIGVYDNLRGEVPKAFITLKEGENLEVKELKTFLKGNLAHFKIPHYFEFLDVLPKTGSGKVDKNKLKQIANKGKVLDGTTN